MFSVVDNMPPKANLQKRHVYLETDRWDDWGKFCTQFQVYVVDAAGKLHTLGDVKIGEVGLKPGMSTATIVEGLREPNIATEFAQLGVQHFSLGQNENYYETLNELDSAFKLAILTGLRDCANDLNIFDKNFSELVMTESLLRKVDEQTVKTRFNRLAHGNAMLTQFKFNYKLPNLNNDSMSAPLLEFQVIPNSEPPTNVHVLIGRNGVGKTRCIQKLSRAILFGSNTEAEDGKLQILAAADKPWSFAGLVSVSFSVFDDFDLPNNETSKIRTQQVGLREKKTTDQGTNTIIKTPEKLANDFVSSLEQSRTGPRAERWLAAIKSLESDPLFAEADVGQLLTLDDQDWKIDAEKLFKRLSSGHAIVMLTITRLVELVDERTLVILDEPEGHLHPPLLAAFIRCISDLLIKRNGVALIATHSPVVLQEVPRSCVWKLRRSGETSVAERPGIETFGENVGVLTREVFGLEVTDSGYHSLIKKAAQKGTSFADCVSHFDGQLGAEARAILMSLIANRSHEKSNVKE